MSAGYGVPGRSSERKKRYSREGTVFLMQGALHFRAIATKLTRVVCDGSGVTDMEFQEHPFNERRGTSDKVLHHSTKYPSL
jgi:hypothetical protein